MCSLRELILQHVTGGKLIDLTEVSTLWNSAIGNSEAFARKVKFCIREFATPIKTRFQIETIALTSVRRYNNYQIIAESVGNSAESSFLERNDWKHAEIIVKHFINTIKYEAYLNLFTPSIVELELRSIYPFSKIFQSSQNLNFKKLRSLTILNCCSEVVVPFMKVEQITKLSLVNLKQSTIPGSSQLDVMIPSLVHRQKNLTYLELNGELVDFAFTKSTLCITALKSYYLKHLKTLVVSEPTVHHACQNLLKFIAINGSIVESIHLNGWSNTSTIYHIWNDLPNLKQFHQNYHRGSLVVFDEIHHDLIKLKEKATLEQLTLTFTNVAELEVPWEWLRPVIKASPNLIELVIQPGADVIINLIYEESDRLLLYCFKDETKFLSWARDGVNSEMLNDFCSDDESLDEEEEGEGRGALSRQDANSSFFEGISDEDIDDFLSDDSRYNLM